MCILRRTLANTYGNHPTSGSTRLQRCIVFWRSQVQTQRKSILTKCFYFSSVVPDKNQDNTSRWSTTTSFLRPVQFINHYQNIREASGRAILSVGLRTLACWDCGFESRRGHGCLSSVLCIVTQWSLRLGDPSPREALPSMSVSAIRCNNNPLHLQWASRRGQTEKERKKRKEWYQS
jgi:hypothetical protein